MKKTIVTVLVLALNSVSTAGPLGLEMGMTLSEIQSKIKLKSISPYTFSAATLPDGHPDFDDYRLTITPQHGLCKLTAWTPDIRTSVYGTDVLSEFDNYFKVLSTKYGIAKRFDFLRSGSIWNERKDWMMALLKKERTLSAFWIDDKITMPDNLSGINIEAYANSRESGMIAISYEFKNAESCIGWIKANKNAKL